ncbi:serine hydrolase domain-containing protein [Prauserella muralis]|uniref:Serine hydrolase n=1 Tax=Prauserella muralis TaxID=588067 RepID=A0A2V4AMW2_9PSEU|nr:serine hydrolase domain-containing protein [Prauserella muralis]PXY21324.1 serine hydrolase [Prauserella muralis]TWE30449.1 CubicO group peptidase (beta-lactamase class C family) [Prauserella muralis]
MSGAHGVCAARFAPVRDLLERRLRDGDEVGASVCVIEDGEPVVDLWGGVADPATGAAWTSDTLVNTYSLTKTMTALVALALVDRGVLDPDAPVARYWPEFGAAGKGDVLVRHVLGHTSGVCGWERTVSLDDVCDTEAAAALLAAQEPWWTPGDGSGYQAVTHGHLVGEIARRVTGRSLGTLLREEFTGPAGADFWLGAPASVDSRVAALVPPATSGIDYSALDPAGAAVRTLTNPVIRPADTRTRTFLAAELGALNGQGNARSVARVQSIVSHGGTLDGTRYLSPSAIERVFAVQSDGVDRVLGAHLRFGLGYALPSPRTVPAIPQGRICWWSGFGGSIVVNDLDRRLTFAYVMNGMAPGLIGAPNASAYVEAVYSCLDTVDGATR